MEYGLDEIILEHTTKSGDLKREVFPEDATIVELKYRHITTIDLEPLSRCGNLETLDLVGTSMKLLPLTPLAQCKSTHFLLHPHLLSLQIFFLKE